MNKSLLFGCAVVFFLFGCSGKQVKQMAGSTRAPAAEATVQYGLTNNNNVKVDLKAKHLAPPSRISSGATTYVVWVKPMVFGSKPSNVGAFLINEDLEGGLNTIVPYKDFEIFVTPEMSGSVTQPGTDSVLRTQIVVSSAD